MKRFFFYILCFGILFTAICVGENIQVSKTNEPQKNAVSKKLVNFENIEELDVAMNQSYEEKFENLLPKAETGDIESQYCLGNMYKNGKGVKQDYLEAIKWYRMAAKQGYGWAQYNLAHMYAHGEGVKQNLQEAAKWYLMAAEQGHGWAQCNLGNMYS